jgi:hypothetical protein
MFALILMQFSFFTSNRILNGGFYRKALEKSEYFTLLRKDIDYGFKNLSMVTSIPEEIFINSVNDDAIKSLSIKNISSAENYMKYKNKYVDSKFDTSMLLDNVKMYSEKYAQENKVKFDSAFEKQIAAIAEDAGKVINNHAVLFNINAVEKYSQFQSFRSVLNKLYNLRITSVIFAAILIALLVLLNITRLRRGFLWIGSSFIPAAIITLVPSLLAVAYRIPYKFAVSTPYLKLALRDISVGYIKYFIVTSSIFLIVGITSLFLYTHLSNKVYKKNRY